MTLQASTQFKSLLLLAFPEIFNGGHIRVFTGLQPATSDAAESGDLLGVITRNGIPVGAGAPAGLQFINSGPYVIQDMAAIWTLLVTASGTAGWFRLVGDPADDGSTSFGFPRLDGKVGLDNVSAELALPDLELVSGDVISPLQFFYTIPPVIG